MAVRVRVRRLNDGEGKTLQRIVRRGGGSEKSIVKWRRAMVVLASAGGNDVNSIARLVQTSPDRVREMIHRFNDLGMRSLDARWAGGRPRLITTTDRELIVKTAKTRPTKLRQPFTHRSVRTADGDPLRGTPSAQSPAAGERRGGPPASCWRGRDLPRRTPTYRRGSDRRLASEATTNPGWRERRRLARARWRSCRHHWAAGTRPYTT